MFKALLGFVVGALAGPLLKPYIRPVAKELIKGGIRFSHEADRLIAEVQEEFEDLQAEAKAETAVPLHARKPS